MSLIVPHVQAGPYTFGMSPDDVKATAASDGVWYDFDYQNGKLVSLRCDIDAVDSLEIGGENIALMNRLDAALHVASLSNRYGQAQGGSLYFDDLGIAILQFESHIREFWFFADGFDHGEPLQSMTLESIRVYYDEQVAG